MEIEFKKDFISQKVWLDCKSIKIVTLKVYKTGVGDILNY